MQSAKQVARNAGITDTGVGWASLAIAGCEQGWFEVEACNEVSEEAMLAR